MQKAQLHMVDFVFLHPRTGIIDRSPCAIHSVFAVLVPALLRSGAAAMSDEFSDRGLSVGRFLDGNVAIPAHMQRRLRESTARRVERAKPRADSNASQPCRIQAAVAIRLQRVFLRAIAVEQVELPAIFRPSPPQAP